VGISKEPRPRGMTTYMLIHLASGPIMKGGVLEFIKGFLQVEGVTGYEIGGGDGRVVRGSCMYFYA
jgi:hypothetical protein